MGFWIWSKGFRFRAPGFWFQASGFEFWGKGFIYLFISSMELFFWTHLESKTWNGGLKLDAKALGYSYNLNFFINMPNLHRFKPCAQNQEPRYMGGGGGLKSWECPTRAYSGTPDSLVITLLIDVTFNNEVSTLVPWPVRY
jgi:hypothetical protein